ncbi:MAG: hypothetical protein ACK4MF_05515 [Hyphomicrobiaceae bacterium]
MRRETTDAIEAGIGRPFSPVTLAAHVLSALAVLISVLVSVARRRPLAPAVASRRRTDLVACAGLWRFAAVLGFGVAAAVILSGAGLWFPVEFRWVSALQEIARSAGVHDSPLLKLLDEMSLNAAIHRIAGLLAIILACICFLLYRLGLHATFARRGRSKDFGTAVALPQSHAGWSR